MSHKQIDCGGFFSISGNVGCAHACVFLIGPVTRKTESDEKGFYIFDNLSEGTYTVVPYKSGEGFRPTSQTVIANADVTVKFIDPSSVVDSRASPINHSRTAHNFPVDSRAAGAPVDCRVAPNIPQNSRP